MLIFDCPEQSVEMFRSSTNLGAMRYITLEVDIDHGRIVPHEPEKLPDVAKGILTILPESPVPSSPKKRERVNFPIIKGDGQHLINPTPEELDASHWGD